MMVLSTKRPWNWKVFLVLVGLIIPAAFANGPGCLPKYYANALLTLEVAASRSIFAAHLFAKSNVSAIAAQLNFTNILVVILSVLLVVDVDFRWLSRDRREEDGYKRKGV